VTHPDIFPVESLILIDSISVWSAPPKIGGDQLTFHTWVSIGSLVPSEHRISMYREVFVVHHLCEHGVVLQYGSWSAR